MSEEKRKGYWKCTRCHNVETFEREVYCWKCGEGQMVYVALEPPKLRVIEGGRSR